VTARRAGALLALGIALAAPGVAHAGLPESWDVHARFEPGQALVRYASGVDAAERREVRDSAGVDFASSVELSHTQVVSFDGPVKDAVARLEDQPGVVDAQPNYVYHALAAAPNDTFFSQEWGLAGTPGVNVLPAWDRTRGAGQIVAIVDTGIDLTHPDLSGNLVPGHDFVDGDNVPDDFNLHGTHVAGTVAADDGNGIGVSGVAPQAKLMPVRSLDADGLGNDATIANGIIFAADNGATVINLSLGGPAAGGGDQALSDAIDHAGLRGAVVVSAAGNDGTDNDVTPSVPCVLDPPTHNNICVAAVTRTGARSSFSNFGRTTVDVGAPGGDGSGTPAGDILSAKPSWRLMFTDDFSAGLGRWNATHTSGLDWGLDPANEAATDSPPTGVPYENNTDSQLQTNLPVNLTGQRGCRIDYNLARVGIQPGDGVGVGVFFGSAPGEGTNFSGDSGGFFEHQEQAIPSADNRADVLPTFVFQSNASGTGDGAYVDDFSLECRGNSYPNTVGPDTADGGGSYTAIAGTSMAAPHVAGVAALVRAADPGAPATQVIQAIVEGARPDAGMQGVTMSGGVADAAGAIDRALALPDPGTRPPAPKKPRKPRVLKTSVNRKGVVTMLLRGDARNTGRVTLTANVTAARVRTVAKKSFRIRSNRRATVRMKLSRPARKQLKRKRKLRLRAKIVVRNAAGATKSASARVRIALHRR
jgi:thermitase